MVTRFFGLFFIFYSLSTFAFTWNKAVRDHVDSYKHPFPNPFAASLWGTCNAPRYSYNGSDADIKTYKLISDRYKKGYLKIKLGLIQNTLKTQIKKRPLMIVLPGAFSDLGSQQAKRWMRSFIDLDYHVAVFPNPWSEGYVGHGANHLLADVPTEAETIYALIKDLTKNLEDDLSGDIRLFGLSYGGFLATAVTALDAESEDPLLTQDTTVVSAPFDLGRTLELLDGLLDQHREEFGGRTYGFYLDRTRKVCSAKSQDELSPQQLINAEGVTSFVGFQQSLRASIERYDKVFKKGWVPDPGLFKSSEKYWQWRKSLTFGKYLRDYAPELLTILDGEEGKILHWYERSREHSEVGVRFFAANDDFLNDPNVYDQLGHKAIVVEDGGHFGFRSLKWFSKFLTISLGH